MADAHFPGQHTTTTSVTTTAVSPQIRFDPSYIRILPGILKIACIVINLIGFICIQVAHDKFHSRGGYFVSVAMTGFWFTGIMLVLYLFHVCEKFYKVPWLKVEFIFNALWTLLYFIAAALACAHGEEAYIAAGIFGFAAMGVYAFDAYLKFTGIRNGEIAQGSRSVLRQQTTTVPA